MPLPGEDAMRKYQEEKRKQLILVAAGTLLILAGIWFGLISSQKANLKRLAAAKADASGKLDQMNALIKNSGRIDADLLTVSNSLATLESTMATGDLLSWAMTTFRQFTVPYTRGHTAICPG
jgi:type II secretory pathway component PulM